MNRQHHLVGPSADNGLTSKSEEELKAEICGADINRALRCYQQQGEDAPDVTAFKAEMARWVYKPTEEELRDNRQRINNLLQRPDSMILICMYEEGGPPDNVPAPALDYMINDCGINPLNIMVVNHMNDGKPSLTTTKEFGVRIVDALAVVECFRPRLYEVTRAPELKIGKGIAHFTGMLAIEMLNRSLRSPVRQVFEHDSEMKGARRYDALRHLAFPMVTTGENFSMVMTCKNGLSRNNTVPLAACVALRRLARSHRVDIKARKYIKDVWIDLMRPVWRLTGERMIRWEDLRNLPTGTRYTLETTINHGVVGLNKMSGAVLGQVVNPHPRLDGCNTNWGEQRMMTDIGEMTEGLPLVAKHPHQMTMEEIEQFNAEVEDRSLIPIFEEEHIHGPITCNPSPSDRLLPAVRSVIEEGMVDLDRLEEVLKASTPPYIKHSWLHSLPVIKN